MSTPSDLVGLADCKAWLGLTSSTDDALLGNLISGVSRAILCEIGRPSLLPALVEETFDGGGEDTLSLRDWPVTQVVSVSVDGVSIAASGRPGQAGWVLEAAASAPPGTMQRLSYRAGVFPRGTQNVTVTYRAGYEIIGEPASVPTRGELTVPVQAPFGPWAVDTGVSGTSGQYVVENGVYEFAPVDTGTSVSISYGYVPYDLVRAACEWVGDRYMARSHIGQSAKSLGGQETTSFIVKAMPDLVDCMLQPYRRVAR